MTTFSWATQREANPQPTSLSAIMSEQFIEAEAEPPGEPLSADMQALVQEGLLTADQARAMSSAEEVAVPPTVAPVPAVPTLSSDLKALVAQGVLTEDQAVEIARSDQSLAGHDEDDDEQLARALEAEERIQEQEAHEAAAAQSNRNSGSMKLTFATSLTTSAPTVSTEDDGTSGYELTDELGEFEEECRYMTGEDKHNPDVVWARNMKRLEKNRAMYQLGDVSSLKGLHGDGAVRLKNSVYNSVNEFMKKQHKNDGRGASGRSSGETRQTRSAAYDSRARVAMNKLVNRGIVDEMYGIIRSGKEASVCAAYGTGIDEGGSTAASLAEHQPMPVRRDLAIKIFFTTLSDFRNRAEYLTEDPRFYGQHFEDMKYSKALKMWTQKEYRNYLRIFRAGIPCPEPLFFSSNILVMTLIGSNGRAAPQLKEVQGWSPKKAKALYRQAIDMLRDLHRGPRLVHADFSEYNLLVHQQRLHVIDVGQAVDLGHPKAQEYLRRDVKNISSFFAKIFEKLNIVEDAAPLSVDEAYAFIVETEEEDKYTTVEEPEEVS